ncbi:MAG: hypothetical protein ACR2N2_03630 [Acidimicrobiia bacterium]
MPTVTALRLPIEWETFGWDESPVAGGIALHTGDPGWAWSPTAPAFAVPVLTSEPGEHLEHFTVDHVVLLVPDLDQAIGTLDRSGLTPRLRMKVSGRPAAFFRAGTVLEVIEAPVRDASLYGIALSTDLSLETVAIEWKGRGLNLGDVKPAIQKGRRIMTVHGLDAGLAVMSADTSRSV